jgi:hypothetical protein
MFLHLLAREFGVVAETLAIAVDVEEAAEEVFDFIGRAEAGVDGHVGVGNHALVEDLFVFERVVVEEVEQGLDDLGERRLELDDGAGFKCLFGEGLFADGEFGRDGDAAFAALAAGGGETLRIISFIQRASRTEQLPRSTPMERMPTPLANRKRRRSVIGTAQERLRTSAACHRRGSVCGSIIS